MAGKVFVNDNAGVFVRLIDRSQRPGEPRPRVMSGGFAINSERGLMNTIYYVENAQDMCRYFGKKNWRALGKSMYDLETYLEGGRPAYVVRVGKQTNGEIADSEKLAYVEVSINGTPNSPLIWSPGSNAGISQASIKSAAREGVWPQQDVLCWIYAKGEGEWGNKLRLIITNTDSSKNISVPGDGKRIFSLQIEYDGEVVKTYPRVSFNPYDMDRSGSLYIENVLADSEWIGVVINKAIDPDENGLIVETPSDNPIIASLNGGISTPMIPPSASDPYPNSTKFANGLKQIFENWVETDPWILFNAGQEIENPEFQSLFGNPLTATTSVTDRSIGLTSMPEYLSFDLPHDAAGLTTEWIVKLFQWLERFDRDTNMDVLTSPIGFLGRTLAEQDVKGNAMEAPAGYRRGVIEGVKGISKVVKPADRVEVVKYKWNPIKKENGQYIFWDCLTSLPLESSLSNIHVMLAFQRIRRNIEDILKDFLFEKNSESTVNTMLGLLRNSADTFLSQGYADEIRVEAKRNQYGTDQILIDYYVKFYEVARTIVVDFQPMRSDQPLIVSLGE